MVFLKSNLEGALSSVRGRLASCVIAVVAATALIVASFVKTPSAWANPPLAIPEGCDEDVPGDWSYTYDEHEQALAAVDLESSATKFSLLADFEGTSIIIRVKDAETDRSLGVIKTDTSNTSTVGEVYAYRLARVLGFAEIVAPTIPVTLNDGALRKLRDLMNSRRYRDANKEANRIKVLREVENALQRGVPFTGAFKVWVPSFMFHAGLGTRTSLFRMEITRHLGARMPQPEDRTITLSQTTRLYSPQGTYRGQVSLAQLAQDYSNMLLMDALMGQVDRFAGANVHFRSLSGERTESGSRQGLPLFEMGDVRLLALDNGASLKARQGDGLRDLQGGIDAATRIERFSPVSIARLRALYGRLHGAQCSSTPPATEVSAILSFLGIQDPVYQKRAYDYFPAVMEYIDRLERANGDRIYFTYVDPTTVTGAGNATPPGGAGTNHAQTPPVTPGNGSIPADGGVAPVGNSPVNLPDDMGR